MAKILLVEDNEMNRDMLSRRLRRKGYEVVMAVDGEQAVAIIKKNLANTGFSDRADVQHIDAFGFLRTTRKLFDLIYIAPPQNPPILFSGSHAAHNPAAKAKSR